jgi:K+/H+ antiporter YhaU regulatory subunit KhtT
MFQREVLEFMEISSGFGFSKIVATQEMIGKSLAEAGFGKPDAKDLACVVAIRRGREPIISPPSDEVIQTGDQLIVAAPEEWST